MHKTTAYARRASLDPDQLKLLLVALRDDVDRYRVAVTGYTPEKMAKFGSPYLTKLEAKIAEVEALFQSKAGDR